MLARWFSSVYSKCVSIFSPEFLQRWQRFKANKKAYVAFWIFLVVFLATLFCPLIANDKPLVVYYKQHLYFPLWTAYPETVFDGVFETETEYKDPVIAEQIQAHGWMLFPPIAFADQSVNYHLNTPMPVSPHQDNVLGTDDQGRDVLARVLYGLRVSILFGLALTVVGSLFGIMVGALQGYFGGWVDLLGQRVLEVWGGLPQLFMTIILVSFFSPNIGVLFGIMLLFGWMSLVPLVRAEVFRVKNFDYVRAARSLGASSWGILLKHVLPNSLSASLSQLPFILVGSMTSLTTLDYLGYGLPAGSPSLGELISQGQNNLDAPWLGIVAFFTLAIVLTLLIFVGEGLRDAFDPRVGQSK